MTSLSGHKWWALGVKDFKGAVDVCFLEVEAYFDERVESVEDTWVYIMARQGELDAPMHKFKLTPENKSYRRTYEKLSITIDEIEVIADNPNVKFQVSWNIQHPNGMFTREILSNTNAEDPMTPPPISTDPSEAIIEEMQEIQALKEK